MEVDNNMTNNYTETTAAARRPVIEPPVLWFWIIRLIIALITILGNGVVIFLITTRQRLHTRSNWFLLSLAVADFSVGFFITPSGLMCSVWLWCDLRLQVVFYNFILYTSTASLWLMTFDRYVAVVRPLLYISFMTDAKVKIFIASTWGFSTCMSMVRLALLYSNPNRKHRQGFRLAMDLIYGFCSCVTLALAYAHILYVARKHLNRTSQQRVSVSFNHMDAVSTRRSEREMSWTNVLGVVVLLFVCCYSLNVYISFCLNFKLCTVSVRTQLASLLFVHLNSGLNFLVYSLLKKDIRRELLRLYH